MAAEDISSKIIIDDSDAIEAFTRMIKSTEQLEKNFVDLKNESEETFKTQQEQIDGANKKIEEYESGVDDARKANTSLKDTVKDLAGGMTILGVNVGETVSKMSDNVGVVKALITENVIYRNTVGLVVNVTSKFVKAIKLKTAALIKSNVVLRVVSTSLKLFGKAILATGVGALVIALGALIAFFTRTQRGADLLARVMGGLGAAVDVIIDRFSAFGETMVNAFKNPQQALKDFGKLLVENIINRFEGVIRVGKILADVVGNLWDGEFAKAKESAAQLGGALVQVATGLDEEQQQAVVNVIKDVADEIKNEAVEAGRLIGVLQNLRDASRAFLVEQAELNRTIAEQRLIAEDVTKSQEERIEAFDKASEAIKERLTKEKALKEAELATLQAQIAQGESLNDVLDQEAQLKADIIALDSEAIEQSKELQNGRNALIETFQAEIDAYEALVQARLAASTEATEKQEQIWADESERESDALLKQWEAEDKAQAAQDEKERRALQNQQDAKLEIIKASLALIGQVAGEVVAIWSNSIDKRIDKNQELQDDLDSRAQLLEENVDIQRDLAERGLSNTLAIAEREVAENKKLQEKAAKDEAELRRKKLKAELLDQALQRASALATAIATIFLAEAGKGALGVIAAIAAGVSLLAFMATIPSKVKEASKLYKGGRISDHQANWRSDKGNQRGHRIEGTNLAIGGEEFIVNGDTTREHLDFIRSLNAGAYKGMDLAAIIGSGYTRNDARAARLASKRSRAALASVMGTAMSGHTARMIAYMSGKKHYVAIPEGAKIMEVTDSKIITRGGGSVM